MTAILTADIVASTRLNPDTWTKPLELYLQQWGASPFVWEIFRGDSFQFEVPEFPSAVWHAIAIKALLKEHNVEVRIAIGLGEKSKTETPITRRQGSAFVRSGQLLEQLKPQKLLWAIATGNDEKDKEINLLLKLCGALIDDWLPQSAAYVSAALAYPEWSQQQIGTRLGIAQAAVSRRRKRAHFELIMETENHIRTILTKI